LDSENNAIHNEGLMDFHQYCNAWTAIAIFITIVPDEDCKIAIKMSSESTPLLTTTPQQLPTWTLEYHKM